MSVSDSILKTIDYAIEKRTSYLSNMDVSGIIVGLPDNNDAYLVRLNDADYRIPNGSGIGYKIGDLVWVHSPNGDFNKKFIISTRSSNSKSFTNDSSGDYGEGSTISPDDIITDAEIDEMFA